MGAWPTINSAPKDGTWVLGFIPAGVQPQKAGKSDRITVWPVAFDRIEKKWVALLGDEEDDNLPGGSLFATVTSVNPTRWMPLPCAASEQAA